jgi:hypothetical protein
MLADGGKGRLQVKAGDTVFECVKYDYGCANDDTRTTGVEHRSYTLNQNGDYPFFTVPVSDVEEIK